MGGTILVTSEEESDATELRAEFRCTERRKKGRYEWNEQTKRNEWKEYWETATLHFVDERAAGEFHLTSGHRNAPTSPAKQWKFR